MKDCYLPGQKIVFRSDGVPIRGCSYNQSVRGTEPFRTWYPPGDPRLVQLPLYRHVPRQ